MNNINVLVVEDNRVTAKNITKNLEEANYIISNIAGSGEEALER